MREKVFSRARGLFSEFRAFAVKGNAFELAIAVVLGNAFTAIVNSLVANIITPLLGLFTGNVDFKGLSWAVNPSISVGYGLFIQAIVNFLLVSLAIFAIFKFFTTARKSLFREEAEKENQPQPYEKPAQERLLEEIRDLLKRSVEDERQKIS